MIVTSLCLVLLAAAPDAGVKIGIYSPTSGGSIVLGSAVRNGALLAVDEINAAGGVLGKKIIPLVANDESNPDKGIQIVQNFIDNEKVIAIIGPANTGVAAGSTKFSNMKHVPQIITGATGNPVNELFKDFPENYVFRFAASDAIQATMMVQESIEVDGSKKVAIFHDVTPYGTGGKARIEAAMDKRGYKPTYIGSFKIGEKDMTEQLTAAKAAGVDAILVFAIGPEGAAIARSLEKMSWKVQIYSTWALSNADFITKAGPYGNGTRMPQTFIEYEATLPKAVKFINAYRAKFGVTHIEMGPAAAQSYDAVHVLALAIQQAGTTEGAKVKAAMENLKAIYDGATGHYSRPWSPSDHEAIKRANILWGMALDGQVVPAKK